MNEDAPSRKPDPALDALRDEFVVQWGAMGSACGINRTMAQIHALLMVSDTDSNLRSARAMEMATVGVLCGLGEENDLLESDLILANTPELLDWLWVSTPQLSSLLRTPQ